MANTAVRTKLGRPNAALQCQDYAVQSKRSNTLASKGPAQLASRCRFEHRRWKGFGLLSCLEGRLGRRVNQALSSQSKGHHRIQCSLSPSSPPPAILALAALSAWHLTRRSSTKSTPKPSQTALLSSALLLPAVSPSAVSEFCRTLRANPTFMSAFIAWSLAQTLKVFTTLYKEGRLDIRKLVASGGMPSSHSSLCVALTTSVALIHGIQGSLFPVALGFSLIVMYDAAGVRLHAGKQAEVLNRMIEDMYEGHPVGEIKLKELLGHTPLQVLGGALVGLLVALWYPQSRFAVVR